MGSIKMHCLETNETKSLTCLLTPLPLIEMKCFEVVDSELQQEEYLIHPANEEKSYPRMTSSHGIPFLLALCEDHRLDLFISHFHLMSIQLPQSPLRLVGMSHGQVFYEYIHGRTLLSLQSEVFSKTHVYVSITRLLSSLSDDADSIIEALNMCAKKWKDALKPIVPKLLLLQSTMEGYGLRMSVLEFLFTLASCGMWHPAAHVAFSSHWGDQNLTRLRSAVDAASKYVLRVFVMDVTRLATNIHMKSTDLLKLLDELKNKVDTGPYEQVKLTVERFLLKLDDGIEEARLARDQMLLFLQFVRDSMEESSSDGTKPIAFDLSQKIQYSKMFDPRRRRCQNEFNAQTVPEFITGTFLFAYLNVGNLPKELSSSSSHNNDSDNHLLCDVRKSIHDTFSRCSCMVEDDFSLLGVAKLLQSHIMLTRPKLHSQFSERVEDFIELHSMVATLGNALALTQLIPTIQLSLSEADKEVLKPCILKVQPLRNNTSIWLTILCHDLQPEFATVYGARIELFDVVEILTSHLMYGEGKTTGLVGVAVRRDQSQWLFRIALDDILFSIVVRTNYCPCENATSDTIYSTGLEYNFDNDILRKLPACKAPVSWRGLNVTSFKTLRVSGARGVVVVVDAVSGLQVVDMEGEEVSSDDMEISGSLC